MDQVSADRHRHGHRRIADVRRHDIRKVLRCEMPGECVAPKKCTVDHEELRASLARAWVSTFNETPTDDAITLLVAQSAHETDRWTHVWNYSLAGVKDPKGDKLHTYLTTHEVLSREDAEAEVEKSTPAEPCEIAGDCPDGRVMVKVRAKHPWSRFRAYPDLDAGAAGVLRVLSAPRYAKAIAAARIGDAMAFVRGLKAGGYFTGSFDAYLASVTRLQEEFRLPCLSSVGEITDALVSLGYQVGTGYTAAVQRFQADHDLVADGIVGPKTRAAIRAAL